MAAFGSRIRAVPTEVGRLSKLLVNDRQLASSVTAETTVSRNRGVRDHHRAQPRGLVDADRALVDSTLASFATTPVTAEELARFNAFNRVNAATSLQLHFARADTLAHDEVFTGDPASTRRSQRGAHSDSRRRPGRDSTIHHAGRVVMSLVPAGKLDLISKPNLPYTNVTPPNGSPLPGVRP